MTPSFHIALLRPRIPQNTGNIGRLALGLGCRLHLVGELGFSTDEKACRRAGLDYWQHLDWTTAADVEALYEQLPAGGRVFAFSTHAAQRYTDVSFRAGDCLLFGDEVRGLPSSVLEDPRVQPVRIPLSDARVRSFNLANSVAMALGEAVRQLGHPGALPAKPRRNGAASCTRS